MEFSNKGLVENKLIKYFEKTRLIQYKKGELLFRPGDDFSNIYFIKSGYVRLYLNDDDGKEITINVFRPVFYLSLFYAIKNRENRYYFEALTDIEMWRAPKEEVIDFIINNSDILAFLAERLFHIVDELMRDVEQSISGDAYLKVATIIISLAKNSGKQVGNKVKLGFKTTHRLIASLTGLSRETASIQIKKLERENYINQNKSLLIINDFQKMESDFSKE